MATAFDDVKPWPAKAPPMAAAPIGHNKPPMDVEARAAFDAALDSREGFRARVASLLGAADRASAIDNDTAGRCGELVKQIRAAVKVVEEAHVTTKAPYLAAGRAVDAAKNDIAGKLDDAKRGVEAKQSTYLREQEAIRQAEVRRQREAEEARRREEAERARAVEATEERTAEPVEFDPPPPIEPERTVIRGDYGAAVSGTKVWHSQVTDYEVAFISVANNAKVREAIDTAIKALVRGGVREIEGVRIWSDIKASNR